MTAACMELPLIHPSPTEGPELPIVYLIVQHQRCRRCSSVSISTGGLALPAVSTTPGGRKRSALRRVETLADLPRRYNLVHRNIVSTTEGGCWQCKPAGVYGVQYTAPLAPEPPTPERANALDITSLPRFD